MQRDFFSRKEEHHEAWDSLMGRLTEKLGEDAIFRARTENSHRPEDSWARILRPEPLDNREPTNVTAGARRPVRLLAEPIELKARGDANGGSWLVALNPVPGARNTAPWQVVERSGPERITGEWWKPGITLARDYYRIRTQHTGEELWIYITPEQKIFLHGFF